MIELRRYPDLPSAWSAAGYLRRMGVLARGYDRAAGQGALEVLGYGSGRASREAWVAIAFDADTQAARELLDEHDELPGVDESDWAGQEQPDLSRLDRSVAVLCMRCGGDLRARAGVRLEAGRPIVCARCDTPNDPVEAVVAGHGPEALLGCYPEPPEPEWIDDETLSLLRIPCPRCRSRLDGLPARGACPDCGSAYDKRGIVERSFMEMPR